MSNKLVIIVLLTMALALSAVDAYGNYGLKQTFASQYGIEGTKLDKCSTCMRSTSSPATWNAYGEALRGDSDFDRNNPAQALENIEQLDSDEDGFTNIGEIRNLTSPGDPGDYPAASTGEQNPAANPADEKTLNTMFNALVTLSALVSVSILVRRKNV